MDTEDVKSEMALVERKTGELSIQNNADIKKVGTYVKCLKEKHKKTSKKINNYLDDNTKEEREKLEKAMDELNNKVKELKETDYYNTMQEKLEKYEDKIQVTMTNVFLCYKKAIKKMFKEYPNKRDRENKLLEFHSQLEDAFLSEDEKKIIKTIQYQVKKIPHRIVSIPLI